MPYEKLIQKELNDWYLSRIKSSSGTNRLVVLSSVFTSAVSGEYEPPFTEESLDSLAEAEERRLASLAGVQLSDERQDSTQRLIQWAIPKRRYEEYIRRLRQVNDQVQNALDELMHKISRARSPERIRELEEQEDRLYELDGSIMDSIGKLEDELLGL